jgi:hypothetical protein
MTFTSSKRPTGAAGRTMTWLKESSAQLIPVVKVIGVLGLGVLLTWLVVKYMGIRGGAVAVTCLLLPALIALAFSGQLSEISAGGITAKFRKAGKQPVRGLMVKADAFASVGKGAPGQLRQWINEHADDRELPVILTVRLGEPYVGPIFRDYVDQLRESFTRFTFVVVLDQSGAHVCHISSQLVMAWAARRGDQFKENGQRIEQFLSHVSEADTGALLRTPGVRSETVTKSTKLTDALKIMNGAETDVLLVLDEQKHPRGILQLITALSEILLAMTS